MPSLQTRKPKIAPVAQLLRVDDLTGGLELRLSPSLLKPSQSRQLRNWTLQEPGALVTYPGWQRFSTTTLGPRRMQGGQRVYLGAGNNPFTLVADAGKVYRPDDGGIPGAAVLTGLDVDAPVFFPHDRSMVAVYDGFHTPQKSVDGTTWTGLGIAAPAAAPTVTAEAGGALIAGHQIEVSYTYKDDGLAAESSESPAASATTAGANLTIRVAVIASADPQVDKIVIYARDITANESTRRKVGEFANTTTTHDLTSNTWATNVPAPTDHTRPIATLQYAVVWKNRWWAPDRIVGNRLYFTQIFEPQSWPALFFIDIPFERGDSIAAVIAQGDTLCVFGFASKPFVIIGQTSLDFEVRPALGAQAGAFGQRAVEVIENGVVHAVAEGTYIFDGSSDRLLTYNVESAWRDLVQFAAAEDLARLPVVFHGQRKELRIGTPRLAPWGTPGEFVLDLNRTRSQEIPAWTMTDRPVGGYIHWNGREPIQGNRGRLFSWHLSDALINEEAIGHTANGADLICDVEMSTHATGGYVAQFVEGYMEFQPATGRFSITAIVDGVSKGSQDVNVGIGFAVVGTARVGFDTVGSTARQMRSFTFPMSAEGRTLALRARYAGQTEFKWFTYVVNLVPESELSSIG